MRNVETAQQQLRQLVRALQPHNSCRSVTGISSHPPPPAAWASAAAGRCVTFTSSNSSGNTGSSWQGPSPDAAGVVAAGTAAAAAAVYIASSHDSADATQQQQHQQQQWSRSPSVHQQATSPPWLAQLACSITQRFTAAAEAPQQQQQQRAAWTSGSGSASEPLSGAIAALDEDGLTNHPLDYNPITNEHTAAMTLAKQAGLEAYQQGRYAEAERRFKEALVEARAGFPPDDPHIPSALHYLAEFYRNVGRLDEAEPLYRETITQLEESLGERHWMYSAALCSLAALHEARGQYAQAMTLLETALELRRVLFGGSSYLYADTAALLAKTLMQQHTAAAAAGPGGSTAASSSSSSSSGGWFRGGGKVSTPSAPADVLRAIQLWQTAITIVEDSGSVAASPVIPWLLDLAKAQQVAGQPAAAVVSLQKALEYMALPPQEDGSSSTQQQQQQTLPETLPSASSSSSSSSSSSGVDAGGADTLSSVMQASGGNVELARLKLTVMASEVAERLVDAQLSAGDLVGARHTLRQALEARIALLGRHLVIAKTMTRLSNLLTQPPADPSAPQLAPHFAASAIAIADTALQAAQRTNLWRGVLQGAMKAVQTGSVTGYKAGLEAERSSERLLAALQLGNASLALGAAEKMNGRLAEAESALRHGVAEMRWVLGVSAADLDKLSSSNVESSLLARIAGLLVDLKLTQMDCLEALAAVLMAAADSDRPPAAAAAGSGQQQQPKAGRKAVAPGDEAKALLDEADRLAADLTQ